jgi:hypothetical protein
MLGLQKSSLYPLMKSKGGIHLTAYIPMGDETEISNSIEQAILTTKEYLEGVLTDSEQKKFLEPVENLKRDLRLMSSMQGNIAIFRTQNFFRVLRVPIEVGPCCVVASTFHIKPLLKWYQIDKEFLFLGFQKNSVCLYKGNQNSINLVDALVYPSSQISKDMSQKSTRWVNPGNQARVDEVVLCVADWLANSEMLRGQRVFIAGSEFMKRAIAKKVKKLKLDKNLTWEEFETQNLSEYVNQIRQKFSNESKLNLQTSIVEFYQADDLQLGRQNIFQIAKAAVQGQIKKLIIAESIQIFGTLDKNTGSLTIHPAQLNHEDDDVLDDIAQQVIEKGGEVIVADIEDIPQRRPVLAILEKFRPDQFAKSNYERVERISL